jgi:hypothetical protein
MWIFISKNNKFYKMKIVYFVLFLFALLFQCKAQQVLNTGGVQLNDKGGSMNFTVGQVAFYQIISSTHYINEGVQQVYPKKTTSIDKMKALIDIMVYPNPSQGKVTIILPTTTNSLIHYSLTDVLGKEYLKGILDVSEFDLNIEDLRSGTYLLFLRRDLEIRCIKILKVN